MNPLLQRLARLRRRLVLATGARGLAATLIVVLGCSLVAGLLDWFLYLPSLIRGLLLVGLIVAGTVTAWRVLCQPLLRPRDDLALALRLEEAYPELNDGLASIVQFLQEPEDSPTAGSASMRRRTVEMVERQVAGLDFGRILQGRTTLRLLLGCAAVCAAGWALHWKEAEHFATAARRLYDPFGHHTWTQVAMHDCPTRIAKGQIFVQTAVVRGVMPEQARIEIDGLLRADDRVKIENGTVKVKIVNTQEKGTIRFRVLAGDGSYPPVRGAWHEVEVVPPPELVDLDGEKSPHIYLDYPAYAGLPTPHKLSPGRRHIVEAIPGTVVTLRAAADRPLRSARVEYRPDNVHLRTAAFLMPLGASNLNLLGSAVAGHQVWGSFEASFEPGNRVFAVRFQPWINGSYVLRLVDEMGLPKDLEADLRLQPDPVPVVQLLKPASSQTVLPDAEIALRMIVHDEQYAVRSVFLEYRRRSPDGRWLDEAPRRVPLYDTAAVAEGAVGLFAALARPLGLPVPPPRLRPKQLEMEAVWSLRHQFQEGDIVVLQGCADDFCDVFLSRVPGRSHEIELRIVGKRELARLLDDGLAQVQQEMVRLQKMQQEALDRVQDIRREEKNPKAKDLDQELIEAEQKQKQILERIGRQENEGLRREINKLLQTIRDNKLPPSEVQDHLRTLRVEMERLAQEELQQLEPHLAEARKKLLTRDEKEGKEPDPGKKTEKQPDKQPEKQADPLAKVEKLQTQAAKALEEMGKFLGPWAGMHEIKGKARELLARQKDLEKETEKLQDRQEELARKMLEKMPRREQEALKKKQEELKEDLARKAEMQNALADKAQDLLGLMEQARQKRLERQEFDEAARLKESARIGEREQVPQKMREAGKDLAARNPRLHAARQQQEKTARDIEKMLGALEKRQEDDLDRLEKKRQNAGAAQEKLEKLGQEQERLQKKVRDALKIEDPKEREAALKKLAEEQRNLRQQAQDNARDLARQQEEDAARAMNRAAQEMEKAARRLEEGQDPQEEQQEAQERVEDAQARLERSEDELEREQLARIVERLEGLKKRQDVAVERGAELHKKVQERKRWSRDLLDTLSGDIAVQEGLAQESRSLKEKLKEAKVFEHVLEKAAGSMDRAAEAMKERKDEGRRRQLAEMEKEELADEDRRGAATRSEQEAAARRLARLVEALKNDPRLAKKKDEAPPQQAKAGKEGDGKQEEKKGGTRGPGDGIPPLAQLKVLRAEQSEVNERTKDFAQRHPNVERLDEPQRRELERLREDQAALQQLFERMTAAPEKKGDQP